MAIKLLPASCGLVFVLVSALACSRKPVGITKSPDVNVDILCNEDGSVTATVAPWRAETTPNGSFTWTLRNSMGVEEMDIGESGAKPWPFQPGKKFKVKKGEKVTGKPEDGKTGPYHYAITAICTRPDDPNRKDVIIIDPDMIIPT